MIRVVFFIVFCFSLHSSNINVKVSAKSAIVIDKKSGRVLYEKNANDRFFPSSLTKVASVYYVLETVSDMMQYAAPSKDALIEIDPEEKHKNYNFPSYILEKDGSKMYGLSPGKPVLLRDILYGTMLVSGNNAANVLAEVTSGSISSFMRELNEFLKEKGLKNTNFKNPHGLHFPGHFSSAYDLAILTKHAMANPTFAEIVKTVSYKPNGVNQEIKQNNKLLQQDSKYYYPKAIGVKTGYTFKSGYNLIAAAEDNGRSLIGVVLGCDMKNERYEDIINLFDKFFSEEIIHQTVFSNNQIFEKEFFGAKQPILAALKEDINVNYYPSLQPQLEAYIEWTDVDFPIKEGQVVGNLIIKDQNEELARALLYSQNSVSKKFLNWVMDLIF